jgi:O-antigen ligase
MKPRALFVLSAIASLAALLGLAAVLHQQRVRAFGAVDGLPDPALAARPDNLLAINVALEHYEAAELESTLDDLRAFGWLRQSFAFTTAFAVSPTDSFREWDAVVNAVHRRGQRLIAVLHAPATLTPEQFGAYGRLFAERYADRVDVYQILDEPNLRAGWDERPPSAAGYAALLQAAYTAIHTADPTATVLLAALAPTTETGPDNISELVFLQQLYDAGAAPYFDAAAGKPYGFYTGPADRQVSPQILNFSRLALLREVMERNGDGHKLLWISNFGWNTRRDSLWGQATPEQQIDYTLAAFQRAQAEWPWAGPMALELYRPDAPESDPRWGFALVAQDGSPTTLGQSLFALAPTPQAVSGNYPVRSSAATYRGAWGFSELGADIPEAHESAQVRIEFQGTDFAVRVRRGDYRAYLYMTVDGQPANLLPRDARGAYLVLTSPDLQPEVVTLAVASGLAPDRKHTLIIQPERGWGQWAFVGFSVGQRLPLDDLRTALAGLSVMLAAGVLGMVLFGRSLSWGAFGLKLQGVWGRLGDIGQMMLTGVAGAVLFLSTWLALEGEVTAFTRRFGDAVPLIVTALTAGLFYFSPSFLLALAALAVLFGLFFLRPDLALAFVALFIPFYLFPRMLWERGASLVEFSLWLTLAAWGLRRFIQWRSQQTRIIFRPSSVVRRLSAIDWGVLALLAVSALSVVTAARQDVAVYEFRTVILGPIVFYALLRVAPLGPAGLQRIAGFFILGAVAIAAYGLYQYFTGAGLIVTEEGVARIRSVYGSPNNLGLYLGRALPVAVAVIVIGRDARRRWAYALGAVVLSASLGLSFSRGALGLGVPAALAMILVLWQGRRGWLILGALTLVVLITMPLLMQIPRFASMLDWQAGTGFFRLNLWRSAWRMFLDHPWLGVGLDNFLYAYRSFYILPEAWQEPNLSHPHNIALDFLSRLGLLGFACGLWLLVSFWRTALAAWRRASAQSDSGSRALSLGLMALVTDMVAHGLVDHSFFLVDLAFVFCLALAVIQRLRSAPQAA